MVSVSLKPELARCARSGSPRWYTIPGYGIWLLALCAGCGAGGLAFPDGGAWPAAVAPPYSAEARLCLTDDGDDTLAIVSTAAAPAVFGFAPVGDLPLEIEGPHHLAASPDGKLLYVNLSRYAPGAGGGPSGAVGTGSARGRLLQIDAATYRTRAEVTVDRDPGDVILTRDGRTALVSHYDLIALQTQLEQGLPAAAGYSTIAIVDTTTMAAPTLVPVCATAHGLALSADEKTLYVACSLADELAVVDLATRAVKLVVLGPAAGPPGSPSYFPYAVTVSPSDGSVWVSCNGSSNGWSGLRVYDPKTSAMDDARALRLPGIPMFGGWLPDGKTLVLPQQGIERVSLVDTTSSTEIAQIDVPDTACLRAHMIALAADGERAWLSCEGDHVARRGTLVALGIAERAILGFTTVGLFPDGVVLLPPAP